MRRRDLLGGIAAAPLLLSSADTFGEALEAERDAESGARRPLLERRQLSLNAGWSFHRGDIVSPPLLAAAETGEQTKAGWAVGAAATDFDDSMWQEIELPHDWAIASPPAPNFNEAQGYRERGVGWYRRALRIDPADRGQYIELQFEAIATNATIWFNGTMVAQNWSGYTSIYLDVTAFARYGDDLNIIAIRVDAEPMEGWWYEGAGIYRHAWLVMRPPLHIITDGVHATPVREPDNTWRLTVNTQLRNIGEETQSARVTVSLLDDQIEVARTEQTISVGSLAEADASTIFHGLDPALWSPAAPHLYRLRVEATSNETSADRRDINIGFRTVRFDADEGFFLNDEPLKIKGVCIHQDHAGVGVAVPDALVEWRVRQLKQIGCNAIRSAHHAPSVALLDACDRVGMLVCDENRNFRLSEDVLDQLQWLVKRDRSRACVFMWTLFNEEPMQSSPQGYEITRRMQTLVRSLDDTRPISGALNGGLFAETGSAHALDVTGINYQQAQYDAYHATYPDRPILSTEDTSGFMTRGAWETDRTRNIISSYDDEAALWGATQGESWRAIAQRPFVAGGFVWTGFDYYGEPTPFSWPSNSSFFGIMDLCGFPKLAYYLRRAMWSVEPHQLTLAPHWNWEARVGEPIRVVAITNADRVRIFLNGAQVGDNAVDPYAMTEWRIPYQPGRLEAVAFKNGSEVARASVETTGPAVALRMVANRQQMTADGRDAQPIRVEAVDARGRAVPTADAPITFSVNSGRILGVGNGDPNSAEPSQGNQRRLFNGLAQVIVAPEAGSRRRMRVTARSPGLRDAELAIELRAGAFPTAPRTRATQRVVRWFQSPLDPGRIDPNTRPTEADIYSSTWRFVPVANPAPVATEAGYFLAQVDIAVRQTIAQRGGVLRFQLLSGRAEVWINGALAARKTSVRPAPLDVPLTAGPAQRSISVLFESTPGASIGFGGLVTISDR